MIEIEVNGSGSITDPIDQPVLFVPTQNNTPRWRRIIRRWRRALPQSLPIFFLFILHSYRTSLNILTTHMTSFDNLFNLDLFRLLVHSFWINCLLFNYPPLSEITNKHHHHHQQFISHLFIKSPDIYRRLGSFVFYVHNSSRHITLTFCLSLSRFKCENSILSNLHASA